MSYIEISKPDLREERQHRLLKAKLVAGGGEYDILIRNISNRGVGGISSGLLLAPDDDVTVLLPDGQIVKAVVRWTDGLKFGLALMQEISVEAQRNQKKSERASTWEVKKLHQVVTPRSDPAKLRRII